MDKPMAISEHWADLLHNMDELNPEVTPVEPAPSPAPYKDRSAGLLAFGILTILLGCLAALFAVFIVFGQVAAAKTGTVAAPMSTILPAILIYVGLAVVLVWLGIGSIMARRWARALLLIFSWSWLVVGVIALVAMAFIVPKMLATMSATGSGGQSGAPQAMIAGMLIGMFIVFGLMFLILPAIWTFFYNSRHVKATCETRDAVPRWTDACPLPVLALALWLLFGAPMLLIMPLTTHGVMPFFGTFLSGVPGTIFCLVLAGLWIYAARSLYKLHQRGWWLVLIVLCAMMVSTLVTFSQHDVLEMYQRMGYPEAQIEQMKKSGLLVGNRMTWLMVFSMVPFLGYLLFIKRFLRRNP